MTEAQPSLGDNDTNDANNINNHDGAILENSLDERGHEKMPDHLESHHSEESGDATVDTKDTKDTKGTKVAGEANAEDDSNEDDEVGDEEDEDEDDDDDDEDEEEEEDEEDEEPKLKYARLTQHMGAVYKNGDATSTFLVAGDKMIVGTHNGNIVSRCYSSGLSTRQLILKRINSMLSNYQTSNLYLSTKLIPPPLRAFRYPHTRLPLSPRSLSPRLLIGSCRKPLTDLPLSIQTLRQVASGDRASYHKFPTSPRTISSSRPLLWMEMSVSNLLSSFEMCS